MTIQYNGNDEYRIWLSDGGWIELRREDLVSIQDLEFEGSKTEQLNDEIVDLTLKIEEMDEKQSEKNSEIFDHLENICGIFDGNPQDVEAFSEQVKLIQRLIS